MVPTFGALGTWTFTKLQVRYGWSTKKVLMIQAALYSLLPLYGLVGFVTPPGSFGLQNKYELPFIGALHGFLFGATESTCRVQFAELIPRGHEAQFFSLYAITDKGSSWIGPLVVAAITNATGNLRYSFFFLFFSFLVPIGIFAALDPIQGRQDSRDFLQQKHLESSA
ncbi:Autophagy protein 22 [Kappamyces sp. JEL0829]|nr:Autophagy protein 22 [Kappamyces sp. JEL0829]